MSCGPLPPDRNAPVHESYDSTLLLDANAASLPASVNARIGIVGGGQLARMTAMTALKLGCDVVVLERNPASPAATPAMHSMVGDWNDPAVLSALASRVDVVTLENEFVDAEALQSLESAGYRVFPSAKAVALVQDKYVQKKTLEAAGLPVVLFERVVTIDGLHAFGRRLGFPFVLKARRDAYDGRGNITVRSHEDVEPAWVRLGDDGRRALYAEAWCDFTMELATIVTRGQNGELAVYPVVETVQRNHICHVVRAPANVTPDIARRVTELARAAVVAVEAVGSFGIECFLTRDGRVVINEIAPRVHNSGHYTTEACVCSQFENHVRAVFGMPLGSPRMIAPAAVMVNLLGTRQVPARPIGLERALAVDGASVHIYGKAMSGDGRKLGHVTALGDTVQEAEATALRCARQIGFGADA